MRLLSLLLGADDCLLYRVINNNNDQHQLQNDLQQLEIWQKKWQMQFNADKCFTIHLTKKSVSWGTPESTSQVEECVPSSSTC
jgi:hypothetical protein